MPWVAKAFLLLLFFDLLMLLSALLAAASLVRRGSRMTTEEARISVAANQHRAYRDGERQLRLARRGVVIGATVDVIATAILLVTDRLSPELADVLLIVIGIGFLAPLYISLSVLKKGISMFASRCENLLQKTA